MTRQLSLLVVAVVVIASFAVIHWASPPIVSPMSYSSKSIVRDRVQKGKLIEYKVGSVLVKSFDLTSDIQGGDQIAYRGKLVDVRDEEQKYYSKGYARYLMAQGIFYTVQSKEIQKLYSGNNLYSVRSNIRQSLGAKIDVMYEKDGGFVKALLFGEREDLDQGVYQLFTRAGTAHLLALSGFHIGVILLATVIVFGKVPVKNRGIIALVVVSFYGFITGMRPSILRGLLFFALYYLSFLMNQRYNLFTAICISGAIILTLNPFAVYDVGFQLSFAGVLSIALFYPLLKTVLGNTRIGNHKLVQIVLVTTSAQVLTLPLTWYYWGSISFVSIIANLLVLPLISAIMVFGLLSVAGSYLTKITFVFYGAQLGAVGIEKGLIHLVYKIHEFFGKVPFLYWEGEALTFWRLMAIYGLLFAGYLLWEINQIKENCYELQRARKVIVEEP